MAQTLARIRDAAASQRADLPALLSTAGRGSSRTCMRARAKTPTARSYAFYVNTEYLLKCSLKIKDGGTLEKAELKKENAKYDEVSGKTGKAKSATFSVGADKSVEGSCKVVVCTDNSCSSPFKVAFSSN
jgi:hypothetical protein